MNRYKVKDGIEITQFGDEEIIYNPINESIHVLNQTSVEILGFLGKSLTAEEVCLCLQEKYGVIEGMLDDVREMINDFVANEIVEVIDEG